MTGKRWWKRDRTRYAVWQIQGDKRFKLVGGLNRKQAERDASYVNGRLALFKLIAPSGPQDAHAVIEPERAS